MVEANETVETAAFEARDIGERFIWGVVGISLGILLICALTVAAMYPRTTKDRVISLPLPVYPEPRLQADPAAQLRNFRAAQMQQLNGTGWIDRKRGIVHVPIRDAMQHVVDEGIADWPAP